VTEIGPNAAAFPIAKHLAAWAGGSPGTRHGNPWLKAALTEAAWAASRCHQGYLPAQFRRLAGRRGRKRALVAVAHSLVTIIYQLLTTDADYADLGGQYFTQRDRDRQQRRALATLRALGFEVTLTPAPTRDPAPEAA
jgi:hypothetical protein